MCCCDFKSILDIIQSIITCLGIIAAGVWAFYLFSRQRENHPKIEMSADIVFHKKIGDWWIVELVTFIENKGKVQHKIYNLDFDLASIKTGDPIDLIPEFGNQANFPNIIATGSFKRSDLEYFFIEPGVKGKYSYLTRVSTKTEVVLLHSWFDYNDVKKVHGTEKTAIVPKE